ncbi:MAG TPA: TolC family protein [Pedobacter sp.]
MKIEKLFCLIACMLVLTVNAWAQDAPLLTLKDAIAIALKNNYNIKLSQNNSAIAKNNVTVGNAGFLPTLAGTLTDNNNVQNVRQTNSTGVDINTDNVHSSTLNYGANLNWTVFNGFSMFANYDQLKKLNELGEVRARDTVNATIASVISTYYGLVNQNQQLKALKGTMEISRTQLRFANDKFKVGRASKLDVLNAQVNLNTDTATYLTQLQQFRSIKIQMNQLLIRDLQTDFSVGDTLVVDEKLMLTDIINKAQTQNPQILASDINRRLAEINLRQVKSTRYPQVGLTSGYQIGSSKTPNGFTRTQNTNGFNYGVTASINIFNGFNQWRRERNAKLQIDNSDISYKQTQLNINAQISSLYVSYQSGIDLTKVTRENVAVAKRNLDISMDKYKLGNITPLEIREAEKNYLDAQTKFFDAQYQSKLAEITLNQITNSINLQ